MSAKIAIFLLYQNKIVFYPPALPFLPFPQCLRNIIDCATADNFHLNGLISTKHFFPTPAKAINCDLPCEKMTRSRFQKTSKQKNKQTNQIKQMLKYPTVQSNKLRFPGWPSTQPIMTHLHLFKLSETDSRGLTLQVL